MNNESFVFYESVYKQSQILEKRLGAEVALAFMNAVVEFGLYGVIPEEDDPLWLYGLEQTFTSIGAAKDRRQQQISNGKKGGRPKTIDDQQVIEMFKQGMTNSEIAAAVGCSLSSVEKKVSAYRKNVKTVKTLTNLNENVNDNENENISSPDVEDWGGPQSPKQFIF